MEYLLLVRHSANHSSYINSFNSQNNPVICIIFPVSHTGSWGRQGSGKLPKVTELLGPHLGFDMRSSGPGTHPTLTVLTPVNALQPPPHIHHALGPFRILPTMTKALGRLSQSHSFAWEVKGGSRSTKLDTTFISACGKQHAEGYFILVFIFTLNSESKTHDQFVWKSCS